MGIEHRTVEPSPEELLEILERDGGVIVEGILNDNDLAAVRSDLSPFLDASVTGDNDFWGFETKRVGALMARSPKCRDLALHPTLCRILNIFVTFLLIFFWRRPAPARGHGPSRRAHGTFWRAQVLLDMVEATNFQTVHTYTLHTYKKILIPQIIIFWEKTAKN